MTSYTHYEYLRRTIAKKLRRIGYEPREPQEIYIPHETLDRVLIPVHDLLKYSRYEVQTRDNSHYLVCYYRSKKLGKKIIIDESVDIYEYSSFDEVTDKMARLEVEARTIEDKIAINSYVAKSLPHQIEED